MTRYECNHAFYILQNNVSSHFNIQAQSVQKARSSALPWRECDGSLVSDCSSLHPAPLISCSSLVTCSSSGSQHTCRRSVNHRCLFNPPDDSSWCQMIHASWYCWLHQRVKKVLPVEMLVTNLRVSPSVSSIVSARLLNKAFFVVHKRLTAICFWDSPETWGICPLTVNLEL